MYCLLINSVNYLSVGGAVKWSEFYPGCSGDEQSPIDIDTSLIRYSSSLHAFDMKGYDSIPPHAHWQMRNTANMREYTYSYCDMQNDCIEQLYFWISIDPASNSWIIITFRILLS